MHNMQKICKINDKNMHKYALKICTMQKYALCEEICICKKIFKIYTEYAKNAKNA